MIELRFLKVVEKQTFMWDFENSFEFYDVVWELGIDNYVYN